MKRNAWLRWQLVFVPRMVADDESLEIGAFLEDRRPIEVRARAERERRRRWLPHPPRVQAIGLHDDNDARRVPAVLGAALEAHAW